MCWRCLKVQATGTAKGVHCSLSEREAHLAQQRKQQDGGHFALVVVFVQRTRHNLLHKEMVVLRLVQLLPNPIYIVKGSGYEHNIGVVPASTPPVIAACKPENLQYSQWLLTPMA